MFRRKRKSKAQSLTEYALFLGVVGMAFITLQVYMKRGIQAVIKVAADEVGTQEDPLEDSLINKQSDSIIDTTSDNSQVSRASEGGSQGKEFNYSSTSTGESTFISQEEE